MSFCLRFVRSRVVTGRNFVTLLSFVAVSLSVSSSCLMYVFSFSFVSCLSLLGSTQIHLRLSDEKTPLREVTVEFQDASRDTPRADQRQQQQQQQTAQVDQPSPTLIKY